MFAQAALCPPLLIEYEGRSSVVKKETGRVFGAVIVAALALSACGSGGPSAPSTIRVTDTATVTERASASLQPSAASLSSSYVPASSAPSTADINQPQVPAAAMPTPVAPTIDPASQLSVWSQLPSVTLQATYLTVPPQAASIYDVEAYFNKWWDNACQVNTDNTQLIDGVIADPATSGWLQVHNRMPMADDCGTLGAPTGTTTGNTMAYSIDIGYGSGREDTEQMTFQYFPNVQRWLLIS